MEKNKDAQPEENTDLSDLPEILNNVGFKNVFVIDEHTDFSELPNPFPNIKSNENNWLSADRIFCEQIDELFFGLFNPIRDLRSNIQEKFRKWYPENIHIVNAFYKWSLFLKRNGKRDNYSSQMIVHKLRWDSLYEEVSDDEFKLNQNNASALGRIVMALDPELDGMFRTKEHRNGVA